MTYTVYVFVCPQCGCECRVTSAADCPDKCLLCDAPMEFSYSIEVEGEPG